MKVGDSVELQVKISIETAGMFEELKCYYTESMGMNISKSDVLYKAISDVIDIWEDIDWEDVNEKKINIDKYEISTGSLRPKLQVTSEIEEKLNQLKQILPKILKVRSVTLGVCIKFILKFTLLNIELQHSNNSTIKQIIEDNQKKYFTELYSEETKLIIDKFVIDILNELDCYEIKIKKK